MTISVIMANYRGAAFLDAAIGSVLGQTEADLELLVADDPDFDNDNNPNASTTNFRKSKSSHETRQTLLYLLDSAVRRKMCKTVLELGGNAVLDTGNGTITFYDILSADLGADDFII